MYRQQRKHLQSKDGRESIPNRIVSLSKSYVKQIVRGKDVKSVEFGAKVNNILVDGISFIERLFGVDAKKVGGDAGYAGSENRGHCKRNGTQASFVKRGRPFCEKKKRKTLLGRNLRE